MNRFKMNLLGIITGVNTAVLFMDYTVEAAMMAFVTLSTINYVFFYKDGK